MSDPCPGKNATAVLSAEGASPYGSALSAAWSTGRPLEEIGAPLAES
jgi:hypothetical protein